MWVKHPSFLLNTDEKSFFKCYYYARLLYLFGRDCTITPMCGLLGGMDEENCMFHSIAYVFCCPFVYQLFR